MKVARYWGGNYYNLIEFMDIRKEGQNKTMEFRKTDFNRLRKIVDKVP